MGWHSAPRVVALLAAILALFSATKFIKLFHALQDIEVGGSCAVLKAVSKSLKVIQNQCSSTDE